MFQGDLEGFQTFSDSFRELQVYRGFQQFQRVSGSLKSFRKFSKAFTEFLCVLESFRESKRV